VSPAAGRVGGVSHALHDVDEVLGACAEVEPDEPGARWAVVEPGAQGNAAMREERCCGVIAEPEATTVQPRQVGR
jgi:hypothetical protein